MELEEYQLMFQLEDHHWWFQSRLMMTEGLLHGVMPANMVGRPRMLDLGCGTGLFLQRRLADSDAFGIDLSPQALAYCHSRQIPTVARANATQLPFADQTFDLVTAFDLIEHVPDDHGLIREIGRILKPGGFLLATVPAHPILWTGHDVSLHHHRRYKRSTFDALFMPDDWQTIRMTACFSLIFPLAAMVRLIRHLIGNNTRPHSDTRPTPEWINRLMIGAHRYEAAWLRRHNLPVGISFLTLRRKTPIPRP